jgi:hypothetical protein
MRMVNNGSRWGDEFKVKMGTDENANNTPVH